MASHVAGDRLNAPGWLGLGRFGKLAGVPACAALSRTLACRSTPTGRDNTGLGCSMNGCMSMTVQELIDQLQGLPPNNVVLVEGYENGWDSPDRR